MKAAPRLFDAHLHLQDSRLAGLTRETGDPVIGQLTNGTHPDDWDAVAGLKGEQVLRAFGVHPWKVDPLPDDWERQLGEYLANGAVSVGEIGLDRWIEPRDEEKQIEVFERQLKIASTMNLPPSIHCLRAWGMLIDRLRSADLPKGFLVHGFGGSRETLFQLLDLGGYVSFSAYLLDPIRHRMRESARACPVDRLLVETDAPDMAPPEAVCRYPLSNTEGRIHHPMEIRTAYDCLAELKRMDLESFAARVEKNFRKLFF